MFQSVSIVSPGFSFDGIKFKFALLTLTAENAKYGLVLRTVDPSAGSLLTVHALINFVKRDTNIVETMLQSSQPLSRYVHGYRLPEMFRPETVRDYVMRIEMRTSSYNLEVDFFRYNANTVPHSPLATMLLQGNELSVSLNIVGSKHEVRFADIQSALSDSTCFQVDLYHKSSRTLSQSEECMVKFDKTKDIKPSGVFIDVSDIKDYILKIKAIAKPFLEFVERPVGFESVSCLLFDKTCSNLAFSVGGETIYALQGALTSRSVYFERMFATGAFGEGERSMGVDSLIPIRDITPRIFKMIIEWIYTMDIKALERNSPTLILDLRELRIAADMYLLTDLVKAIDEYVVELSLFGSGLEVVPESESEASAQVETGPNKRARLHR